MKSKLIIFLFCFLFSQFAKAQLPIGIPIGNTSTPDTVWVFTTFSEWLEARNFAKYDATLRGRFWGVNPQGTGVQWMPIIRDSASTLWFKQPLEQPSYGANLTTNGTFTGSATGWTSTGWTYGTNNIAHNTGNTSALSQSIAGIVGSYWPYQVVVTVSGSSAGTFTVSLGGWTSPAQSGNGTKTISISPSSSGTQTLSFTPSSTFDGTLDDITLKVYVRSTPIVTFGLQSELRTYGGLFWGYKSSGFATGGGNFAIGDNSFEFLTTGTQNTATGLQSLQNLIDGAENTASGFWSLKALRSGSYNTSFGAYSEYLNVSGVSNSAFGAWSGKIHLGSESVFFGSFAGQAATTAGQMTFIGALAARNVVTGTGTVAIGTDVIRFHANGSTATTANSNSVYIGSYINAFNNSDNNTVVIGYGATSLGANTTLIGNNATTRTHFMGNLAIGNSYTPTAALHLPAGGGAAGSAMLKFTSGSDLSVPEAGAVSYNGTEIKFSNTAASAAGRVELLARVIKNSATIDFSSTLAASSTDVTVTVTGAAVGDVVTVGTPASPDANSCFTGWVSATNTVTVRFNNYSVLPIDPASGTYNVIVTKY